MASGRINQVTLIQRQVLLLHLFRCKPEPGWTSTCWLVLLTAVELGFGNETTSWYTQTGFVFGPTEVLVWANSGLPMPTVRIATYL